MSLKRKSIRVVASGQRDAVTPSKKRASTAAVISAAKRYEDYQEFTNDQLRVRLKESGEDPGPINDGNRDLYVRLMMKRETATPTSTPTTNRVLTATPSSTHSPAANLIGRSGGGKGSKQKAKVSSSVKGLVAAVCTPFDGEGELNLSVIPRYVEHLLATGVHHVFVNGTTGEGLSLTVEERKLIAKEWVRVAKDKLTIIIHVGCENLKSSCDLAADAEAIGAHAIGIMPPSYFKPQNIESLVQYMRAVAVSAPSISMYYYHIPSMTGVDLPMEQLIDAHTVIPTLKGIKYTSLDLSQFSKCLTHCGGKMQMFYGCDEQLLGALSMGGEAAIGSTYNYAGKLNNRLITAYNKGDLTSAQLEQRRSQAMISIVKKHDSITVAKHLLTMLGVAMGPPRLPLLPLTEEKVKSLEAELRDIGYFSWN